MNEPKKKYICTFIGYRNDGTEFYRDEHRVIRTKDINRYIEQHQARGGYRYEYRDLRQVESNGPLAELENIMRERGDTYKSLADALGTTRQNIGQAFKGDHLFTVPQIRAIAKRYDMDAETVCMVFSLI